MRGFKLIGGKKKIALKKVCERTEDGRAGIRGTLRGPRGPKKSVTDDPNLPLMWTNNMQW